MDTLPTRQQDAPIEPAEDSRPETTENPILTERRLARKRLQDRQDFRSHLVAYIVFNSFLIAVWALTSGGYFWPAWVLAGWGAGLVLHAREAYFRRPVTEADVDAELQRHRR